MPRETYEIVATVQPEARPMELRPFLSMLAAYRRDLLHDLSEGGTVPVRVRSQVWWTRHLELRARVTVRFPIGCGLTCRMARGIVATPPVLVDVLHMRSHRV